MDALEGPSGLSPRLPVAAGIPRVLDVSGFAADSRCLALSGVTPAELQDCLDQRRPLGFPSPAHWARFQEELDSVLRSCGLDDAAVRLGGTSRGFFSSPYTTHDFPQTLMELVVQVRDAACNRNLDRAIVMARTEHAAMIYKRFGFNDAGPKPAKHFWDSRHRLQMDAEPGDYDIGIASDTLAWRMMQAAGRYRAENLGKPELFHKAWSAQWLQERVIEDFPELGALRERWREILQRPLDFECFDGSERLRFAARPDWWVVAGRS